MSQRVVWISRPAARAAGLANELRNLGLAPLVCPALQISELTDLTALSIYYRDIRHFAASIFVSSEAAHRISAGLSLPTGGLSSPTEDLPPPAGDFPASGASFPTLPDGCLPALTLGASTAAALPAAYRLLTPPSAAVADSRALLRLPFLQSPGAVAVLGGADERGKMPSPLLCRVLARRGAAVSPVPCYVRRPAPKNAELSALGRGGEITAAVAYSADTLRFMLRMLAPENNWLLHCPLFVIHQNIARTAARLGFRRIIIADTADMAQRIADY